MAGDKLTSSLQESLLTLVCVSDEEGLVASGLIDVELFEPPFDEIARAAIQFRQKFGKAPGAAHLDDLFDVILADPKNKKRRIYEQILGSILEQAKGLNEKYVLSRVSEFLRAQTLKAAVYDAAERYGKGDDGIVPDVEKILLDALKFRHEAQDTGTFLNDRKRTLSFLTNPQAKVYSLGIKEFDKRGIGPTLGKAMGFMARKGAGKTWFCIDAAVKAMMQGGKVVHISLEMGEEELTERYMQRLFAVAKRDEKFETTQLEFDELNRVLGFTRETKKPRLSFQDPKIANKLYKRIGDWGVRFGRLVIKQFPTSFLTIQQLEAYLDSLELTSKFIPTMLIVDYPKLMSLDRRQELRLALGLMVEQLRGICVKRNLAGIFPAQSGRRGESAKSMTAEDIGEDYSMGQTFDYLIIYNQTVLENDLGLARLYVDKARSDRDKFNVLITQSYVTGQFVMESAYMPLNYWKKVKDFSGTGDEEN